MTIVSGSNDGKTGVKHTVKKIVTHPKFVVGNVDHNIAVMQISDSFKMNKKTKAIKLPAKEIAAGAQVVVAGYGDTSDEMDSTNGKLQQGTLTWLSRAECNTYYTTSFPDVLACAYNKGKTTLCNGDWSDALVKNGTVYGIFVASWTDNFCTSSADPGLYTDVFPFVKWIKSTTGITY